MGIQGLLPFLKSIHRESHLRNWAGKTLAIDGYVWLHRGVYSCAEELCLGKPTSKHVNYFLQRIQLLRRYEVSAYVVFDGDHLPNKKLTEDDRDNRRRTALTNANKFLAQGNLKNAREEFVKAVDVTPQLAHDVIVALRSAGVKFVVAPYEADAQLRYLEMKGEVDAIITEDSDLLVYGARNVLFKLDHSGHCVHICRDEFGLVEDKRMPLWTDSEFRQMAMLSGCDYLSSIPGLGIKKAHDLIRRLKTAQRAIKATRLDGKLTVPPKYEQYFQEAELTFLHQFVYDSTTRSMVPLNPLPDPPPALEYLAGCGEKWPDRVAIDVAEGRLDPLTKEIFSAHPSGIKTSTVQARTLNQHPPAREVNKQTPRNSSHQRPAASSSQQPTLKQFSFSSTPKTTCSNSVVRTPHSNHPQSTDQQNSKRSEDHRPAHEKPSKFFEDGSNQGAESSYSPSFELDLESQGFVTTQTTNEELASDPAQRFTQESWDAISDVPTDGSVSGRLEHVKPGMQLEPMRGEDLQPSQMHPIPLPTISPTSHPGSSLSSSRSRLSNRSASASNKENQHPTPNNEPDSSVCPSSSQGHEEQTFMKLSDSDIISSEPDECAPPFVKHRVTIITPTHPPATTSVRTRRPVSEPISRHANPFPISSDPILSSDDAGDCDETPNAGTTQRKGLPLSSRGHPSCQQKRSQGTVHTPLARLSKGVKRSASAAHNDEDLSPSLARVAAGIRNRFTFQKPTGTPKSFAFPKCRSEGKPKGDRRVSERASSTRRPLSSTGLCANDIPDATLSDRSFVPDPLDFLHHHPHHHPGPRNTCHSLAPAEPALAAAVTANTTTPSKTPTLNRSSHKLSMFLFKGTLDPYSHTV